LQAVLIEATFALAINACAVVIFSRMDHNSNASSSSATTCIIHNITSREKFAGTIEFKVIPNVIFAITILENLSIDQTSRSSPAVVICINNTRLFSSANHLECHSKHTTHHP